MSDVTGEDLLHALAALANPHRVRVIAALAQGRNYVSQLARELGISRPLLHLHLQKLEAAGLIVGELHLSAAGKAMKYYEVRDFDIHLTPTSLSQTATELPTTPAAPRRHTEGDDT